MSGGKTKNLEILQSMGLSVPEFYEINTKVLRQLDTKSVAAQTLKDFEAWFRHYGIVTVAVRSSAEDEDSIDRSFAGQFTSVMEVTGGEQLLAALRLVANSKPAAGYSNGNEPIVHAIVQRYIEPDVAGVLFTVNPSNGLPEMLINAAAGHGSTVVEGKEVSSIHIDRLTGDIRSKEKTNASSLLSLDQIKSLQELGETIEKHMQFPQDIEWAFSDNILYVLQTRPITKIAHVKIWDNANIGESFPGIVLPLTFSIARRGYELVYKSQGLEAGLSWYQLEANHRTFHDMVGLFAGRMYYNLASWYKFIGLFPNNNQNQKYLDEQIQTVGDAAYLPPSRYPFWYKVRFFLKVTRRTLFFEREKKHYWSKLDSAFKQYEALPVGDDLSLLFDRYTFIEQMIVPQMGRSADNDFFVMIYHGILKKKLHAWLGEADSQTVDFLGSLHDVISARQATLLTQIADYINHDLVALKLLEQGDFESLDTHLLDSAAGEPIREYRAKFLHRFAEDQKIEAKNPLLTLSGFYALIKAYQQLDAKAVTTRRSEALKAEQKRNTHIMSHLGIFQRIIYKVLVGRLKHHLRIREHNRLLRGKTYAYLRELFITVGVALEHQGLVDAVDDVYYLDIEELLRLVNGTGYNDDIRQIVSSRRHRYQSYKNMHVPARFITTGLADKMPEDLLHRPVTFDRAITSFKGTISSPGNVTGKVIVLDAPIIPKEPFDILVVSHTDPGWTPLIALAKGLVIEHGGILSHAAIVTRELGIPSIIGVEGATQKLKNGMRVQIDSAKGTVDIIG